MADMTVRAAGPDDIAGLVGSVAGLFAEDGGRHDPYMDTGWPAREDAQRFYVRHGFAPAGVTLHAPVPGGGERGAVSG